MVELSGAKVALFRPFQISDEEYLGVSWKNPDTILNEVSPHQQPCKVAVLSPVDVTPHSQIRLLVDRFGAENGKVVPELLILYAVIEDAFWVRNGEVGVYDKLSLNVQHLVGNNNPLGNRINPHYKELLQ